ncbi:MAG: hypothetical protein IPJ88_10240 [Myxococcales bacterium]|nr:MAG: hypothetical protein IPJ88_10240 [Myxococcales bacterium]
MKHALPFIGKSLLFSILSLASVQSTATADKKKGEPAAPSQQCVSWEKEVRYRGYGYMHIVQLKNECNNT